MEYRRRRLRHRCPNRRAPRRRTPRFCRRPDRRVGLRRHLGAGRQRHRRPRASTRSRLRWQPARLERIGPAHYGSAPGLRDWPQGRSIAHGANREQGPGEDQTRPHRLCRVHRHRSHRRRGYQPPRTRTAVPAGTRQHPGKQPDRRHGHQPRCVSIARPQVCYVAE